MSIQMKKLYKAFDGLNVLEDFNMTLDNRRIHCLFGPSGCGKSTLLNLMAEILTPDSGEILGMQDLNRSFVFQEERLLPWRTVLENIQLVLENRFERTEIDNRLARVLDLVELTDFQNYYPAALSGGMKQRVSLARAFAYEGDVLAMDEPFKGLHFEMKRDLMDAIVTYWHLHMPYTIFITHDVEEALYIADDIYILEGPPLKICKHLDVPVPHEVRKNDPDSLIPYKKILMDYNRKNAL